MALVILGCAPLDEKSNINQSNPENSPEKHKIRIEDDFIVFEPEVTFSEDELKAKNKDGICFIQTAESSEYNKIGIPKGSVPPINNA